MSATTDAYKIALEAMKGHRVDKRWMVAANVVGALREAGLIPYPTNLDGATDTGEPNAWPADAGEFAARWNAASESRREEIFEAIAQDASSFESAYFQIIVEDAS